MQYECPSSDELTDEVYLPWSLYTLLKAVNLFSDYKYYY